MKNVRVISLVVLALAVNANAGILLNTGFDSSEGWSEGGVTVGANPAVGNWFSYYESIGISVSNKVDLSGNGMDFGTSPASGDGLLYADRLGTTKYIDAVVGWSETTDPIIELNVDMQVYEGAGSSGSIVLKNNAYNGGIGVGTWLGAILVTGNSGSLSYYNGTTWVNPSTGDPGKYFLYPTGGVPVWGNLRLVADTTLQMFSVYGTQAGAGSESIIMENIPFINTSGDSVPRSAVFSVGSSSSRAYWDNLEISSVPEPATISLLAAGSCLFYRSKRRKA